MPPELLRHILHLDKQATTWHRILGNPEPFASMAAEMRRQWWASQAALAAMGEEAAELGLYDHEQAPAA